MYVTYLGANEIWPPGKRLIKMPSFDKINRRKKKINNITNSSLLNEKKIVWDQILTFELQFFDFK